LTAIASFLIAALVAVVFSFPSAVAALCPRCFGFEAIGQSVYLERGAPDAEKAEARAVIAQARERVRKFYGALNRDTTILICASDDCYQRLRGGSSRGMAIYDLALMLAPNGLSETIAAHELSHIEFHARIGFWHVFRDSVPTWFDEGLAVVVSDDARYLDPPGLTDRCRDAPVDLPITLRQWLQAGGKEPLYHAAGCKVQGWLKTKGGPKAVLRLAEQIAGGESFGEAYR
jgi:hypothetical protein